MLGVMSAAGSAARMVRSFWVRGWLAEVVALTIVYLIAARLGSHFSMGAGGPSLVWPAAGVALAAVYLRGPSLWPAILIGEMLDGIV